MKRTIFGIKKNVFFLGLVSLFNDFSAEMVQSVMPVFLTSVLGAPTFAVGLIEGVSDALASVLKLFSGWFSDKIEKRKMPAVVGYALSVLTRSLLYIAATFGQVFTLRIIDRVGKGLRDAPRDALIVESVEKEELGKSFGFHRSMDTLGATLGPLTAFLILPFLNGNYRPIFLIAFFLGLFAIFSFLFVKEQKRETARTHLGHLHFDIFRTHKHFIFVVVSFFIFGLGTLPIALVLLKAKEVGGALGQVPLMYFVYSSAFVLTALPLGKLADKIGEKIVIAFGFAAAIVAYVGFMESHTLFGITIFFIILGLYSAATDSLQRVVAAKALNKDLVATGQGFLNMSLGFSSLGAGIIGGFLWTAYGSSLAFLYAAALSVIGLILFIYLSRKLT